MHLSSHATIKRRQDTFYVDLLRNGNETGLEHFYNRLFRSFSYKARKRVKDDLASTAIAQEAFLRLWMVRDKMEDTTKVMAFLKAQINEGCQAFYSKRSARFHRDLIKLDGIDDYQNFLGGYNPEEETDDADSIAQQNFEEQNRAKLKSIKKFLPNLTQNEQLFIQLCLRYSFGFEKIALHLGGISDVEVYRKVQKTLENLKNAVVNSDKLNNLETTNSFIYQGDLSEEQACIFRLRYELKMSFEEISAELRLSQAYVQTVFVEACSMAKKIKSN
ncbi:hypothetical protein [Mucilaginibacter sp.]|uniref:hypothetical protein n=1 Tax=Mucilaginibacter sp. TaxID=1882438 RepID=UPI0026254A97|nr:hypothetical protein [Mucilaginibacter sp.]MDB4921231.1 hypothetical protein [Mucilaginibacter sp.]